MNLFESSLENAPKQSRERFTKLAATSLVSIEANLLKAVEYNDASAQLLVLDDLEAFTLRRFEFPDVKREWIVKFLIDKVILVDGDLGMQIEVMRSILDLMKKKPLKLTFEWRPFYDTMMKNYFMRDNALVGLSRECEPSVGSAQLVAHGESFVKLINACRRYFPESATDEILAVLTPQLSPFDKIHIRTAFMLQVFLPIHPAQVHKWVPVVFDAMSWMDTSQTADAMWFRMLSRVARLCVGEFDWSPYLPRLYAKFMQFLNLPVGGKRNPLGKRRDPGSRYAFLLAGLRPDCSPIKDMALFTVWTLSKDSETQSLAVQLLQTISTYFFPSNSGSFTSNLGYMIENMSFNLVKRYGKQQRGEVPCKEGLDLEVHKEFIDVVADCAFQALYHKSNPMVQYAQRCLTNIAELSPGLVFPKLLEHSYDAFSDPNKSHRTLSCLKLLSLVSDVLFNAKKYPRGASHLQPLLDATLPGVDPNDSTKSTSVLSFYSQVWSHVPFIDAKECDIKETDNEHEEEARRATMYFKEWSLAFIDRLCKLAEHQEGDTKSPHDRELHNQMLESSLTFWSNLSEDIYEACVTKYLKFVVSNQQDGGKKLFGLLTVYASFAHPQLFLKHATKALFPRLLKEEDGKTVLAHKPAWPLYLLYQSTRSSMAAVVPYLDKIKSIVKLSSASDDKKVRAASDKLLRSVLDSMISVYPNESKNFSPQKWSAANRSKWAHWKEWGCFVEDKREGNVKYEYKKDLPLDMEYHVPTAVEFKHAEEFVNSFIDEAVETLKTADFGSDKALRAVYSLYTCLRGVTSIAGDFDGKACVPEFSTGYDEIDEAADAASVCPIKRYDAIYFEHVMKRDGVSMRTFLARLVHEYFVKYMDASITLLKKDEKDKKSKSSEEKKDTDGDTDMADDDDASSPSADKETTLSSESKKSLDILKVLARMSNKLVMDGKYSNASVTRFISGNNAAINKQMARLNGEKCIARWILVERAFVAHMTREHGGVTFTNDAKVLVEDLLRLSLSEFPALAATARTLFEEALGSIPRPFHRVLVRKLFDVVNEPDAHEKRVRGALKTMNIGDMRTVCFDSWPNLSRFMLMLARSEQHEDVRVQVEIRTTFMYSLGSAYTLKLELAKTGVAARDAAIEKQNAATQKIAADLIDQLVTMFAKVDWKYQVVISVFLAKFIRSEVAPSHPLAMHFAKSMIDPLKTNQLVGIKVFDAIVGSFRGTVLKEGDDESYAANNVIGWNGRDLPKDALPVIAKLAPELEEKTNSELHEFCKSNLKTIVKHFELDHRAVNTGKGGFQLGFEAFASYGGLAIWWPHTRYAKSSAKFSTTHARIWKNIVLMYPSLVDSLVEHFDALTGKTTPVPYDRQRDAECTAAEMFAGILRASVQLPQAKQAQIQETLGKRALSRLDSCTQESIPDWEDAVRYVVYNRNMDSVKWLVDPILDGAVTTAVDSPSILTKRLNWLRPVMIEMAWRGNSLASALLSKTSLKDNNYLYNEYKQVRSNVARMLALVFRSFFRPDSTKDLRQTFRSLERNSELAGYMNALLERVSEQQIASMSSKDTESQDKVTASKDADVAMADAAEEKKPFSALTEAGAASSSSPASSRSPSPELFATIAEKNEKNLCETLLTLLNYLLKADMIYCSDFVIRALPAVFRAQRHKDETLSKYAKVTLATMSWALFDASEFDGVLSTVRLCLKDTAWSSRKAQVDFLRTFIPRHALALTKAHVKELRQIVIDLLSDSHLEVRQAACTTLTSLVLSTSTTEKQFRKLIRVFMGDTQTKLVKVKMTDKKNKEIQKKALEAVRVRHGGVLGLSALVASQPYTLPEWMPPVLSHLADFTYDPLPIGPPLKKVFDSFKRTHQDSWHEFRDRFTADELSRVNDATGNHQFYA